MPSELLSQRQWLRQGVHDGAGEPLGNERHRLPLSHTLYHAHYANLAIPALDPGAAKLAGPWLASLYCKHPESGCSSRCTGSVGPGSVFVVFDQVNLTIWAVATCLGISHGVCPPVTTVQGSLTR